MVWGYIESKARKSQALEMCLEYDLVIKILLNPFKLNEDLFPI